MQANKKITRSEFNAMVENWYGRLNKLKLWVWNNPSHPKIDKACDLAAQMALRLVELSHIYREISKPKLPDYPTGIYMAKGGVPERIDCHNGSAS